jgi:hypothetical protein
MSVRHDAAHNIMVPIGLTVAVANAQNGVGLSKPDRRPGTLGVSKEV